MFFYLGVGANLPSSVGQPQQTLKVAMSRLLSHHLVSDIVFAPWYRSAPICSYGDWYWNSVVRGAWHRDSDEKGALELMSITQKLEYAFGRRRDNQALQAQARARPIDIDLLLFGNLEIDTEACVVPHARMTERAFVLRPLLDLEPDIKIPGYGAAVQLLPALAYQILEKCENG